MARPQWWPWGRESAAASQPAPGSPRTVAATHVAAGPRSQPAGPSVHAAGRQGAGRTLGADILLINDDFVSVNEAVYGLRSDPAFSAPRSIDDARRRVLPRVQQAVGTLLLYQKATARLTDPAREAVRKAVDQQVQRRASLEFGDSTARFQEHLEKYGLSLKDYRRIVERQLLARDYVREIIAPQMNPSRAELLQAYQDSKRRAAEPEMREMLLIEAPFAKFLENDQLWELASPAERQAAEQAASTHIRNAHDALVRQQKPFADVVQAFDRGPQRVNGGSWGMIGRPLRAPYDEPSRRLFQFASGQVSDPIRMESGWCILKCGAVRGGPDRRSFEDMQADLREELLEKRFNEYTQKYLQKLADAASVSSIEEFIEMAARRLMEPSRS